MEIGFDQKSWRSMPLAGDGDGIDWHALRARLSAAYAARTAMAAQAEARELPRAGCFDVDSARTVAAYGHALATVNPNALGNGNSEYEKDAGVAGPHNGGGRG